MAKFILVNNSTWIITNIIRAPADFTPESASITAFDGTGVVAEPGWAWDNVNDEPIPPADSSDLPATITKIQLKYQSSDTAIYITSFWADVKAHMALDADRLEDWNMVTSIPTDHSVFAAIKTLRSWTDAELEAFIRAAAVR